MSHSISQQSKFEWLSFLSALGLLSRIPLGFLLAGQTLTPEHHRRAQVWYPWVGLVIGLLLALLAWLLSGLWPDSLNALMLVAAWVLLTGGLHLDGLADTADAWVGGMGDRDKTLAIMRDPACGPSAVVALCLCLLLKWQLLVVLLAQNFWLLALIPLVARAGLLPMLALTSYARKSGGMAEAVARQFPFMAGSLSFALAWLAFLVGCLASGAGLAAWLLAAVFAAALFWALRAAVLRRIGGYTGDVLGAQVELTELALLLALVV